MSFKLYEHQRKAVNQMHNGCVLWGDVGGGKTFASLAYYYEIVCGGTLGEMGSMKNPKDIYVITTAKKRDSYDWETDAAMLVISPKREFSDGGVKITVDSWNNLGKYREIENAFFVFDEQRAVGSGQWSKFFVQIAKRNEWILLSATPGDTWMDYIPLFIANGWYKNRSEFKSRHVVYAPYVKYPKVDHYTDVGRLVALKNYLLVEMPFDRETTRHNETIMVDYDRDLMDRVVKDRWHVYENRPLKDVSELFSVTKRLVFSDESRLDAVKMLMDKHPKLIVFYTHNYELEMLRTLVPPDQLASPASCRDLKLKMDTQRRSGSSSTTSSSKTSSRTHGSKDSCSPAPGTTSNESSAPSSTRQHGPTWPSTTDSSSSGSLDDQPALSTPSTSRVPRGLEMLSPSKTQPNDSTTTSESTQSSSQSPSSQSAGSTRPMSSSTEMRQHSSTTELASPSHQPPTASSTASSSSRSDSKTSTGLATSPASSSEVSTSKVRPSSSGKVPTQESLSRQTGTSQSSGTSTRPEVSSIGTSKADELLSPTATLAGGSTRRSSTTRSCGPSTLQHSPSPSEGSSTTPSQSSSTGRLSLSSGNTSTSQDSPSTSSPISIETTSTTASSHDPSSTRFVNVTTSDSSLSGPSSSSKTDSDSSRPSDSSPANHNGSGSSQPSFAVAEWNGHKHEPIPETERWVYLVQYTAGAEGWNCTSTDAMCFFTLTYSYRAWHQGHGRIDRLNTPFRDLWYYKLVSDSWIDKAIWRALTEKRSFQEREFAVNSFRK